MEKISSITERLQVKKKKTQAEVHRQKAGTVRRTVQCASCPNRCAMCGYHFGGEEAACPPGTDTSDFRLCRNCLDEYEDYLKVTTGREATDIFWHNMEWVKLWSAWLHLHKAMKDFRSSKEYKELLEFRDY